MKEIVMENKVVQAVEESAKPAFSWTDEQAEVINDRGHNLLVSASAGSGKTTVMIQRIVDLMIEEEIPISNFLVVTFTKASASDMKKKLIDKLLKLSGNSFAVSQIENVETSDISNLHSFCSRLISTYFYEVGIDPAFHVIDDIEANHLKDKALNKLFEQKERDGSLDYFVLFDIFQKKRKDKAFKEVVKRFDNFLNSHIDGKAWFEETMQEGYCLDLGKNACAKIIDSYVPNMAKKYAEKADNFAQKCNELGAEKLYAYFVDIVSSLKTINKNNGFLTNAKNVYEISFDRIPSAGKDLKFLGEEAKTLRDEIKAQVDNFKENYVSNDEAVIFEGLKTTESRVRALYDLVCEFGSIYAGLKKEINGLDFNDLEKFTLKILENDAILSAVKQKYKYVFVDEYQDINNVQERIISLVSGQNNRFMVGDVKQSIYRFRLCDPDIFLQKYDLYSNDNKTSKLIKLNANFRSDKKILKFVDDVFSGVMTEEFGGVDYARDAKFIAGENNLDKECSLNLCYIDTTLPKQEKKDISGIYSVKNHTQEESAEVKSAIAEARLVADKIAALVDKNNPDRIKYGDIAILVGSRNEAVAKFVEVLESFNIPVSSDEKHDLTQKPYIMEVMNFIKFVCNPNDDFVMFNVLKSRLFNFDDDELVSIRVLNHKVRFFECLSLYQNLEDEALKNKIENLFAVTNRFAELARLVNVKELAKKIVNEFSLEKINYIDANGEQINSELQAFIDALPNVDAFEFVLEFENFSLEFENESQGDSVSLMTIHKSKGIEFKAVFLINTSNGFNFKSTYGSILFNKYHGVGMDFFDTISRVQVGTIPISAIRMIEKRKLVEEQQRVLYVALTRAIEKMFVICSKPEESLQAEFPERPTAFINWFEKIIMRELDGKHDENINFEAYKIEELLDVPSSNSRQLILEKADADQPEWFEYEHQKSVDIPLKNSVSKILKNMQENDDYEDVVIFGGSNSSAERGTLYHKVLQNIDLKNINQLDEQFEKIKSLFAESDWKLINQKLIKNVLNDDFFAQIKQDDIILQEREFYANMPATLFNKDANKDDVFVMQGVIDLIVVKGDEIWVLDYKTGQIDDAKLEKYKFQIQTYAEIAEKSFGKKVTRKVICLIDLEKFIDF